MFESNPNLIQEPDLDELDGEAPVPLVLVHDGGGTIFSYYCLGNLERPVYGIFNPYYGTEGSFATVSEMAAHYVRLVREVLPRGPLILGGWSLGGIVALEMANVLAGDSALRVSGVIMVDSIFPGGPPADKELPPLPIVQHATEWAESTRPETRAAVTKCFQDAHAMVKQSTLPAWGAGTPHGGSGEESSSRPAGLPPVFLLRARDKVPVPAGGISYVDVYREDQYLGWRNYRKDMVVWAEDIPGHHFGLFALDKLDAVTEKLRRACLEVEAWEPRG